jgi:hypothetical protein
MNSQINTLLQSNLDFDHGQDMWCARDRRVFVGNIKAMTPIWKPRHRLEDNTTTNFNETGWGVDWIHLAQDKDKWRALMNMVTNLRIKKKMLGIRW